MKFILLLIFASAFAEEMPPYKVVSDNDGLDISHGFTAQVTYGKGDFSGLVGERALGGEPELEFSGETSMLGVAWSESLFYAGGQWALQASINYFSEKDYNDYYYDGTTITDNTGGSATGYHHFQGLVPTLGLRYDFIYTANQVFVPYLSGGLGGLMYRDSIYRPDGEAGPSNIEVRDPFSKPLAYGELGLHIGLSTLFEKAWKDSNFFGYFKGNEAGLMLRVGTYKMFNEDSYYNLTGVYYSLGLCIRVDS